MTEPELLEKYEPVLRFAKSERFFPMAVEPYVERCSLFASGPLGVAEFLLHHGEPLIGRMGKLKSEQFYIRFVNRALNDSDAWVWLAFLSVLGMAGGWLSAGWVGVEFSFTISFIVGLILFMLASPVRLRIIPAALAALFFIALEVAPIWFFLHPNRQIGIAVEYLVLLPIYLVALFYLSVRTMKFILDHIVPEGPGMVMDVLSQATEKIAQEAYGEYSRILDANPQPVYYGRVLHENDALNRWTILQYHFFYAFNDWRLAANGMNHHEGDWEMVAVYLKNEEPYAVLFSQHGAGHIERWDTVNRVVEKHGEKTTHPLVYVALGSHANYNRPQVIRSHDLHRTGRIQRLLLWVDGLIHYIFLLLNPSEKARQIALNEISMRQMDIFDENAFAELRDEEDHYLVSLPLEMATGDGFRAGSRSAHLHEHFMKSDSYLKRSKSNRKTTHPKVNEWQRVLLNSEPDWVQYKGLWGVKSWLMEESGPPGPKWDRPQDGQVGVLERKRWGRPLDWLAELEKHSH
ncbi:MAG: hypothetical protein HY865_05710 [Chloroflexi bacterium]|nr:hypothetical protein [Chloroflexota bacterium]